MLVLSIIYHVCTGFETAHTRNVYIATSTLVQGSVDEVP